MKGIVFFHLSSNKFWGEVMATDDAVFNLVYDSSTEFLNSILTNADRYNTCLENLFIIVGGR